MNPTTASVVPHVDRPHAHGRATGGAHLRLREADRLSELGGDQELALAVGERGREELVVPFDLDPDDALLPEVLVLHQLRLLESARGGVSVTTNFPDSILGTSTMAATFSPVSIPTKLTMARPFEVRSAWGIS